MTDLAIRPMTADDLAFVKSSWLHNYKHNSYFALRIRPSIYFKRHSFVLDHILSIPGCTVLIAHPESEPDVIVGYIVYQGQEIVIHYVYVTEEARGYGVARELVKASGVQVANATFTHWTKPVNQLIEKYPDMIYDPYSI